MKSAFSLLIGTMFIFSCHSVQAKTDLSLFIPLLVGLNSKTGAGLDIPALLSAAKNGQLNTLVSSGLVSNISYTSNTITGVINGHNVTISTIGTPLENININSSLTTNQASVSPTPAPTTNLPSNNSLAPDTQQVAPATNLPNNNSAAPNTQQAAPATNVPSNTPNTQQVALATNLPSNNSAAPNSQPITISSVTIDGINVVDNQVLNTAAAVDLARNLNISSSTDLTSSTSSSAATNKINSALTKILSSAEIASSTSLASTSPSSANSQLVFNKLNPMIHSHKERRVMLNIPSSESINFTLLNLKYEKAKINKDNKGDIKGGVISLNGDVMGVEIGAYIPYDYMNFDKFSGHRAGAMLYANHDWQLPMNLQLATMINANYMATYISGSALTNTMGGGMGTSLNYDNGGDFVPRILFALQYNQDTYYKANDYLKDNHQYLIKSGASLGYRLFDSAVLQAGLIYSRDITAYKSSYNQKKDNDYVEITVGGSYAMTDRWQVNLNYKKMMGLANYASDAVFLGTTIGF